MDFRKGNGGVLRIAAVERDKRSSRRYAVTLDDGSTISVHEDVLIRHRLLKGEALDPARMRAVLDDEERQLVRDAALAYLARRPRSRRETCAYLRRKGFDAERIEFVVEQLKEQGYVDDAQFARQLAAARLRSQAKGSHWIREELRRKGVEAAPIREALDELGAEEEMEVAETLARKKWKTLSGPLPERRRKLAAFLARRGFPPHVWKRAVRAVAQADPDRSADPGEARSD